MNESIETFDESRATPGRCATCGCDVDEHREIDEQLACPNWWVRRRLQLGLSRTEMAARLRSTEPTIRVWEQEKHAPSTVFTNERLARGYETSVETIEREVAALVVRIRRRSDETKRRAG